MAKRRTKTRTHKRVSEEELAKIPRSMVIRLGSSLKNHSLSQLVKDFRNVMQPHTAINLRERKSNKLRDFIVMAGPLGVSDLFIFKQSEQSGNISLRIGKLPRGPTLQFKVNAYSLVKDVSKILKHPKSIGRDSKEFLTPPLLVLNGFSNKLNEVDNHEKLMVTMFQNMFPPIQPQSTKVSSIKRVLMINKDPQTGEIEIRHYAINTKLVEENRNVKKLINSHHNLKKNLPNLSKNSDISDLLLDPYSVGGITSDSEIEDDAIVEIKNENNNNNNATVIVNKRRIIKKPTGEGEQEEEGNESETEETTTTQEQAPEAAPTRKRAIKLTELGPRISMTLVKIEEGLTGSSKTLYHANVNKSKAEIAKLEKAHAIKEKLKAERKAKQLANVEAKKAKKDEKKARKKAREEGGDAEVAEEDNDVSMDESDSDGPEINPDDYENDSDLFSDIEK
ncbi:Brix domain-containing protein [Scheffersomyces coipomensis]|uniref:Brix domain-containing protein n=1 Tax=Scheffersomyces coipomensis TaxID=1788519 RepID=UPI00315C6726